MRYVSQNGLDLLPEIEVPSQYSKLHLTRKIKEEINEELKKAEKQPSARKKILDTLGDLEEKLNDLRAEEGFLA